LELKNVTTVAHPSFTCSKPQGTNVLTQMARIFPGIMEGVSLETLLNCSCWDSNLW